MLHDSHCSVAGSAAVCVLGGGGMCVCVMYSQGGCVCTHCGTPGVCDPRVVQWTQQTTTVGVLCSCSLFISQYGCTEEECDCYHISCDALQKTLLLCRR